VPYLEGGLDEAQTAQMNARLAADPALAAEAERLGRTLKHLRHSAARIPNAAANTSVPADLWPRLRERLEPAPAPRRSAPVGWITAVGAAAVLAFAAIWIPFGHTPPRTQQLRVAEVRPQPVRVAEVPKNSDLGAPPHPSAVPKAGQGTPTPAPPRLPEHKLRPEIIAHDPFFVPQQILNGPEQTPQGSLPPPPLTARMDAKKAVPPGADDKPTLMASRSAVSNNGDHLAGAAPLMPLPERRDVSPAASVGPASAATTPMAPAPPTTAGSVVGGGGAMQGQFAAKPLPTQSRDGHQSQAFSSMAPRSAFPDLHRSGKYQSAIQIAPGVMAGQTLNDMNGGQTLETSQNALSQALQPPLLGDDSGAQQANQALMSVRMGGALDTLRGRLEQKCAQSPRDIVSARMLAATYEFGGQSDSALHERRRLVGLDGVTGEDWFALAEAEGKANNAQAARAAYQHALQASGPLSGQHAALAKQRG